MNEKIKTKVGEVGVGDTIVFVMGPGHKDEAEVQKVDTAYKDLSNKGRVEVIDRSKRILWVYPSQVKEIRSETVKRVARALCLMSTKMPLVKTMKLEQFNLALKKNQDNLDVEGSLDLHNKDIKTLPNKLSVGTGGNGFLDLDSCKNIKKLPDKLIVSGDVNIQECENIEILPEDLKIGGDLYLNGALKLIKWIIKERRYDWLKERVEGSIFGLTL